MKPEVSKRIKEMALDFTSQISVVETPGEIAMAQKMYDTIAGLDYYKKHPELVYQLDCVGDQYGRRIVVAEMNGERAPSAKTIVMIGHFDTVGISDYGLLKEYAGSPDILAEEFKKIKLPPEAKADLESGKYLGKVHLQMPPQWIQGIAYHKGYIYIMNMFTKFCGKLIIKILIVVLHNRL